MRSHPIAVWFAALGAVTVLTACSDPAGPAASTVTVTASPTTASTVTVTATSAPAGVAAGRPDDESWSAATPGDPATRPPTSARPSTRPPARRATPPPVARTTVRAAPRPSTRRTAPAPRTARPPADPAPRPAPRPATSRVASGVRVPNLIGDSLTAAYARLNDLGVPRNRRSPHDISGKTRTVLNPDNWQVCTQRPAAGSSATAVTVYQFGVVKFGERCP